jgi:predicted kinase
MSANTSCNTTPRNYQTRRHSIWRNDAVTPHPRAITTPARVSFNTLCSGEGAGHQYVKAMHPSWKLLIQMSGAPGSGKSTVAHLLVPSIDAVVINHDLIKAFFLENSNFNQAAELAYRMDWVLAEDIIKQGRSIIVDCPCNFDQIIDQGTALARKYGYDYKYIECQVKDIELLDKRLRNRIPLRSQRTGVNSPPSDAGGADHSDHVRALFTRWIEHPCRPSSGIIVVDSTLSEEKCLEYILNQIVTSSNVSTTNHAI